jgi:CBS domain-containing protein
VIVGAGRDVETVHTVQCPREKVSTAFERCCGCSHKVAVDVDVDGKSGTVECVGPEEPPRRARVDVAEAAVRARLGDLVGLETTCVRSDIRLEAVAELLLARNLRAVPVVDEARHLLGIVSKTELLRRPQSRRRPRTIVEIMSPVAHGLPEDAPVAFAISLMASEGLHEVPVVDARSQLIGMLSATDALRWVAQALGYAIPSPLDARAPVLAR